MYIYIYTYTKEHLLAGWATANVSRDATTCWDFNGASMINGIRPAAMATLW